MKKLLFLYSQNFAYRWLCARNWQLQSSGQMDPWPNFINKVLLKNGEAHSCMSCHCAWNFHCARVELSRYDKPKTIYCLELSRKSLPTSNLDNHGICFKKKKGGEKERRKIETTEAWVDKGRQSWNFMLFPDSALVPGARHLSLSSHDHYCRGHLFGLIAVMPRTEFAGGKEKLPEPVSLR